MTIKRAERLLAGTVSVNTNPGCKGYFAYLHDESGPKTGVHGATEKEALNALVRIIYQERSLEVMKQQNWRCSMCGGGIGSGLEMHHIIYRSHGGTHVVENMMALCSSCHQKRHKKGTKNVSTL